MADEKKNITEQPGYQEVSYPKDTKPLGRVYYSKEGRVEFSKIDLPEGGNLLDLKDMSVESNYDPSAYQGLLNALSRPTPIDIEGVSLQPSTITTESDDNEFTMSMSFEPTAENVEGLERLQKLMADREEEDKKKGKNE